MTNEFHVYAAKRYMSHVKKVKNAVRQLQDEIDVARQDLAGLRGVQYSDMPGNPNAYGDAIPDGIAALEEKIRRYCTEVAEWIDVEYTAHEAINKIEDMRFREILWSHYVMEKSWEQIAVDMSYSYEYVRKELFEYSLEALYKVMPEEWRSGFPKAI